MKTTSTYNQRCGQAGGVSLFVVIFAAILFSVIALSFVAIMNQEQKRSTTDELSRSAYDSAMAGVEDAKRVIMKCYNEPAADPACKAINDSKCDTVSAAVVAAGSAKETPIQTSGGTGKDINQAHTCVKISLKAPDYLAELEEGKSISIPLRTDAAVPIKKVKVEWQKKSAVGAGTIKWASAICNDIGVELCKSSDWSMPALMRAQAILPNASFTMTSLDDPDVNNSYFLRPIKSSPGGAPTPEAKGTSYANTDPTGSKSPFVAKCDIANEYMCSSIIDLEKPVPPYSEVSILRLKPMYRAAAVRVTLLDGSGAPLSFYKTQVTVDSTGRAAEVFRRVEARLVPQSNITDLTLPEYAIDLKGSLCKDFSIIDSVTATFPKSAGCQP